MFLVFVSGPDWGGVEELFNLREGERGRIVGGRGREREGGGGEEDWHVMTYQIRTTY